VGKRVTDADIINRVLTSNFRTMDRLGKGEPLLIRLF
jgi:hypothetical protein